MLVNTCTLITQEQHLNHAADFTQITQLTSPNTSLNFLHPS